MIAGHRGGQKLYGALQRTKKAALYKSGSLWFSRILLQKKRSRVKKRLQDPVASKKPWEGVLTSLIHNFTKISLTQRNGQ
jgi:hypothetical protein